MRNPKSEIRNEKSEISLPQVSISRRWKNDQGSKESRQTCSGTLGDKRT